MHLKPSLLNYLNKHEYISTLVYVFMLHNKPKKKSCKGYKWVSCGLLRMINKQTKMAARAPILSRSICSSCMSSQLAPEYPAVHKHLYLSLVSRLEHDPPFRQGLSRHSFLSSHPLPSDVTLCPLGHLNFQG